MSQKVYCFSRDLGDGSAAVCFTLDPDYLNNNQDNDELAMNEGFSDELTFPDNLDLIACGFTFYK